MRGPWATKRAVVTDQSVHLEVRGAIARLSSTIDPNVVIAPPTADLNRVCNVAGTTTVKLQADTTYRVNLVTLTKPIELVGPSSAIIAPQYGYTGTQKIVVNCASGIVIIRGPSVELPIEAHTPVCIRDVEVDTNLTTTNGAKVEISGAYASGSLLENVTSPDTDALGILVRNSAEDVIVNACDFSGHTIAIETTATLNTMALDTNPGVVVVR